MSAIGRTTRFAVFPAFQVGSFCVVYFPKGKRRLSVHSPQGVETKNGLRDLLALNVGRFMFLYEAPTQKDTRRP